MAAKSQPCLILCSFILLIISSIPESFSQSTSQQNIQTYYPTSSPPPPILRPPPPAPANDPPNIAPTTPIPPPQGPSPSGKSSTRAAVGRAIGVTAASTLVLSALVFFLLLRHSKRKRERDNATAVDTNGRRTDPTVAQTDNFSRFNGNLKGVIVDENGLDVLYWRNLEEGEKRTSFKKQYYVNLKDEQKEEEKKKSNGRGRRNDEPVQELPLLRGKSSTSQSAVWGEKQERIVKKAPTLPSGTGLMSEEKRDSSVGVTKTSTPPLPPPPGARPPPSPPQPILASGAVPKGKMPVAPPPSSMPPPPPPPNHLLAVAGVRDGKGAAPPPPPPPISSNKGPSPPPPPSAGGLAPSLKPPVPKEMPSKRSSSVGEEATTSNGNEQVKLKPLHWDKVNPNVKHSMVWDNIDKGSFKFDGDMMEALFGYVATNRKSPKGDGRSTNLNAEKSGPPSEIFILDTRKSQNIAIVLKSLGIARKDIINALLDGQGLDADTLEKLTKIAPTDEELSKILAFDGDPTRLADAESFLYHLLKAVPSAFTRFNALLFKSNDDLEVLHIKESLQSLESACKELRTRGLFLKLLEAVLKAGNRLNAGTSRGNAQAFNLTALRKLSDVKSSDGKTTLLQFVVQEVVRAEGKRCVLNRDRSLGRTNSQSSKVESQNSDKVLSKDDREREYMMLGLPVVGGLSAEFSNVKKAATLDYDLLVKTISSLAAQVVETRKMVAECGNNGGFAREMIGFLDTAELEMQAVKEEETRVMELVKKTTDYYQTDFSKDKGTNTLQLFVIVKDFLAMVDQVCIDIARNVQKKKPAAAAAAAASVAGSSPPESPRVFRFPKLPADFMSDYSKSSSTDSDKDSEVR